jgi:hypothetical protein
MVKKNFINVCSINSSLIPNVAGNKNYQWFCKYAMNLPMMSPGLWFGCAALIGLK